MEGQKVADDLEALSKLLDYSQACAQEKKQKPSTGFGSLQISWGDAACDRCGAGGNRQRSFCSSGVV